VAVEQHPNATRSSDELRIYMDEMWRRLRVFSRRSAAIPAEERGSFEWLTAAGAFWWDARERAGLSRDDVAHQLGVTVNHVRFLEFGLVTLRELSEKPMRAHAEALGQPDLYVQFQERFER
jgi:hypothetical protein